MPAHSPDPVHGAVPRRVVDVRRQRRPRHRDQRDRRRRRRGPRRRSTSSTPTRSPARRPASASASPSGSPRAGSPSWRSPRCWRRSCRSTTPTRPSARPRARTERRRTGSAPTPSAATSSAAPSGAGGCRSSVGIASIIFGLLIGGAIGLVAGHYRGKVETRPHGLRRRAAVVPGPAARPRHRRLPRRPHRRPPSCSPSASCPSPRWPGSCGPTRSCTPQREFVLAARSLGATDGRIIVREVLPNVIFPVHVVRGDRRRRRHRRRGRPRLPRPVGRRRPPPTWGGMIADGRSLHRRRLVDQPDAVHRAVPHRAGAQPRRRPPPRVLRRPGGCAVSRRVLTAEPGSHPEARATLLEVIDLTHPLPHRARHRARRRRRVVHPRPGHDPRHRRRVRLGQDRAVPLDHGPAARPQRRARAASVLYEGTEIIELRPASAMRDVWGTEMAMVFQDPMTSLNPVMKIGKQITESLRHHLDVDKTEAEATAARPARVGRHPRARAPARASTPTSSRAACASAS